MPLDVAGAFVYGARHVQRDATTNSDRSQLPLGVLLTARLNILPSKNNRSQVNKETSGLLRLRNFGVCSFTYTTTFRHSQQCQVDVVFSIRIWLSVLIFISHINSL